MRELLRLEKLSVNYRIRAGLLSAVNKVTFSIREGEIYALVGESGCGKSTVAHSIMRLSSDRNEVIRGRILFEGTDLLTLSDPEMESIRGSKIGMIFQNPLDSLNPVYRSGAQVAEALLLDGIDRKQAMERTIELFREVRIPVPEERVRAFPHELSGGMRQRVMIAMMLSRNPKLLIADEPTTALDVTVEAQILKIMKELCSSLGSSILLITHNFGIVAEIADRVGIMYSGEIVEEGTVREIFENPVHPYAKALLSSLPRGRKSDGRIQTISGSVPQILEETDYCRFNNRCPQRFERCDECRPEIRRIGETHFVRCHCEEN